MTMDAPQRGPRRTLRTLVLAVAPVLLLGAIIAVFLSTRGAGLSAVPAVPRETMIFERTILRPDLIELHLRNTSPLQVTVAQVAVRDGFVLFTATPATVIPRLGRAILRIPYPWVEGEAYAIRLFSSNAVPFDTTIDAATLTRGTDAPTLVSFTLIGLYVGVLPVLLGMAWFPVLRRMGKRVFLGLMALTVGLLLYLGLDAGNEALEAAAEIGGPFQGVGLIGIGVVATFLGLNAVGRLSGQARPDESSRRMRVAAMIALGIGLHNLGEGLAIGAAFSRGAWALGTFLVVGFILQNITEGLGIVAPIIREKPPVGRLALLGILGGAPAIVGTWTGGLASSPFLSVLFLSVGAGAVLEVAWEIVKLIRQDEQSSRMPVTLAGGAVAGMSILYVTGLLVK
jgi:zinc transporter, ZIP family